MKAQELGAVNSHFANPHGYHDDNHYSTARDIALITRAALQTEGLPRDIRPLHLYHSRGRQREPGAQVSAFHSRYIMNPEASEGKYYYPSLIGGKSGSYSLAGECYAAAADRDGIELISVTLKSTSQRPLGRYAASDGLRVLPQYVTTSIEALYKEKPKDRRYIRLLAGRSGYRPAGALRKRDPLADDRLVGFADQATNWQRLFNNRTSVSLTVFWKPRSAPARSSAP